MRILLVMPVIIFMSLAIHTEVQAQKLTYFRFVPEKWRSEVIQFPLDFAPSLEYQGELELLFSPGMFNSQSEEFLSYGFIWAIEGKVLPTPDQLAVDLQTYYYGLQSTVSENRLLAGTKSNIWEDKGSVDSPLTYKGVIEWTEPFVTEKAQTLYLSVTFYKSFERSQWLGFFRVSPQNREHDIWKTLDDLPIILD